MRMIVDSKVRRIKAEKLWIAGKEEGCTRAQYYVFYFLI